MDKIKIRNLEIFAHHGVFPEENVLGQKFIINATLYTDLRNAGKTDELTASIHYGEICLQMEHFLTTHTFKLLERAAESLAETLLMNVSHLEKIKLEIKKPWAPIGLSLVPLCNVSAVSSFLTTKPYGVTDQDDFLNGCLKLRTLLSPRELLDVLHGIEQDAGRERKLRWGPRTLDLDIIFYDDLILEADDLCIPHVDMHRRSFVLEPLHEIAPYKRHPCNKKTVREMLEELCSEEI